jgi:type I restriction enzyme S subunit
MEAIQSSTLRSLRLAVPSVDEQILIRERYLAVEEALSRERAGLAKLRKLKVGLMHDLVTGGVRVPVTASPEMATIV